MNRKQIIYMAVFVITAIFIVAVFAVSKAFAAGQPYSPYPYHKPEETGLIGSQLYALAGGAFASGFSILSNVKAIENLVK